MTPAIVAAERAGIPFTIFEKADEVRFPCLALARAALRSGGAMPTVLNAANEIAVAVFMAGQVDFYGTSFYPKHSAFVDRDVTWRAALLDFTRSFGYDEGRNGFWVQASFGDS